MSEEESHDPGLTILSIDGGGIRGLSSLLILKECMTRLQHQLSLERMPEVYEHFDFVGGSGTGGVSATMLGRLRIPLNRTIDEFAKLAQNVFSDKKYFSASGSGIFKSTKLQQELKRIVGQATGDENARMMDSRVDGKGCKTVVFAMSRHNMNAGLPTPFRSYQASINQMQDCTIWEVLCATTAHPDLFKSIDIGDGPVKESFVDGGLGCSNSLAHILAEVKLVYPGRHVGCVISIGAGQAQTIHIPHFSPFQRLLPTNVLAAMEGLATDSERVAQEMAVRFSSSHDVYFRFNVDQGMQNVEQAGWEQLGEVTAYTKGYMRHLKISEAINKSVVAIGERRAIIPTGHIDGNIPLATNKQPGYTNFMLCPLPTSLFTGREQPVRKAVDYLLGSSTKRKVFVVHGLGGAGKTQMALRIVEKTREHWADIVYADATSVETIETALKAFAELKRIGNTYRSTLQWLGSHRGRWLFVLDNADGPSRDVLKYIPDSPQANILITTRNQDLLLLAQEPGSDFNVSSMEPEEALQLLVRASRLEDSHLAQDEINAAKALLEDLGYLPLAIVQVGGYIRRTRCSFRQYRELYLKQPEQMLQQSDKTRGQLDKYERTIFDAWVLSYDLLSLLAKRLLWAMAFMKRDQITLEIFRRAALSIDQFKPVIPLSSSDQDAYNYVQDFLGSFIDSDGEWDCNKFLNKTGEILLYSLMEYDGVNEIYVLHPLVQSWARMIAPDPLANVHTALALAASLNWDTGFHDYAHCRSIQVHVMGVLQTCPVRNSDVAACFANVLYQNGRWNKASPLQEQVLQTREHILGKEHPDTLKALHSLAMTYDKQGHWKQAGELYLQLVEARQRVLGNKHTDTLTAILYLADVYGSQGLLLKMEELETQVVDTREQMLGQGHPSTMEAIRRLANTYNNQGLDKQAEKLRMQLVDARKRVLGEEHPDTLAAILDLAVTYSKQGRHSQAERLCWQVIDARKRVLGKEHPDTLAAILDLTVTYSKQGHHSKAERLCLQVIDARKRVLGEEHPDTLAAILDLAVTYSKQGRHSQVEQLCLQVINARKRVLGKEHPDTLAAILDLAVTYSKQGRHSQAEQLCLQVIDARKRVLGEEHPDTLAAILDLAITYSKQGHHSKAERLCLQVVNARKRVLGKEHPDTLTAMNYLAVPYHDQGHYKQAEEMCSRVVDARKRVLGEEHPDTLAAVDNLAVYRRLMQESEY